MTPVNLSDILPLLIVGKLSDDVTLKIFVVTVKTNIARNIL